MLKQFSYRICIHIEPATKSGIPILSSACTWPCWHIYTKSLLNFPLHFITSVIFWNFTLISAWFTLSHNVKGNLSLKEKFQDSKYLVQCAIEIQELFAISIKGKSSVKRPDIHNCYLKDRELSNIVPQTKLFKFNALTL